MADTLSPSLASSSLARVQTDRARAYLTQLCKHFAHKTPTTLKDSYGRIEFTAGVCELEADSTNTLLIEARAADPAQLITVEDVVERHLKRFAFREELAVRWVRQV